MVASSSSTFRTHLGRVIRDLSRLLHVAAHGTEALYSTAIIQGKLQPTRGHLHQSSLNTRRAWLKPGQLVCTGTVYYRGVILT